jgi:hypothetical protein
MERYHVGGDEDPEPPPADTGGPQRVMFTTTAAHPEVTEMPALQLSAPTPYDGTAVVKEAGASWIRVWDGHMGGAAIGFTKPVSGRAKVDVTWSTPGGVTVPAGTPVAIIGDDLAVLLERNVTLTPKPTPAPPTADCKAGSRLRSRPVTTSGGLAAGRCSV